MSECIQNCSLCNKLTISQSIVYNSTTNQLIVDLPSGSYGNCVKYCIIFAQPLPTATTLNAQVVFTIGGDQAVAYPFLNKDCTPVLASQIRPRRWLYPTRVSTTIGTGVFKYIGKCLPSRAGTNVASLPVTTTTAVQSLRAKKEVVSNG